MTASVILPNPTGGGEEAERRPTGMAKREWGENGKLVNKPHSKM